MKIRSQQAVPKNAFFVPFPPRGSPPAHLPFWPSRALPHCSCVRPFRQPCSRPPPSRASAISSATRVAPRKRVVRKRRAPEAPETTGRQKTETAKKEAEKTGPKQPVYIVVSLADQHASIYDANGLVTRTRVSTGQAGHRTPTGVFSVIGKERWHRSNIYSGAPMPFMQRITWSGVAMHAGVVPGYPASHGCIRLPAGFAPQLFGMTKMGARVIVTPRDVAPVEFTHTLLPLPKMQPAPAMPAGSQQASAPAEPAVELASMGTQTSTMTTAAVPEHGRSGRYGRAAQSDRLCRGAQEARQPPTRPSPIRPPRTPSPSRRPPAPKPARPSMTCARPKPPLRPRRRRLPPSTRASPRRWRSRLQRPPRRPATTSEADKAAAQSELARAQAALEEARARDAAKSPAAFNAVEAWKRAVAASEAAGDSGRGSRPPCRARVGLHQQEGRPHLHPPGLEGSVGGAGHLPRSRPSARHARLHRGRSGAGRLVDALDGDVHAAREQQSAEARSRRAKDKPAQSDAPAAAPETAAGALDRIELPEGARERIAELLWTGGSLIVSDHPRSGEMSDILDGLHRPDPLSARPGAKHQNAVKRLQPPP